MKPSTSYLLDTNVISEVRKTRPDERVLAFLRGVSPRQTFLSVLTLGELRRGAALRAKQDATAAAVIVQWIQSVEESYQDRIIGIDLRTASLWGELNAHRTRPTVDTLLAATALHHRLTLVTRNVRHVQDTPVLLHNPWLD